MQIVEISFFCDLPHRGCFTTTTNQARTRRSFDIVSVESKNFNEVMDFLRHHFFIDEPLNACLQLVANSEPGTCLELEQVMLSHMEQNLSLMAVNRINSHVMGVCLNVIAHPGDMEQLEKSFKDSPNKKLKILLELLTHVDKISDVYNRFNVQKVFEISILSVGSCCRRQGIGSALLNDSLELARRLDHPLVRVDCSSAFTARALDKLRFQVVHLLRYDEYKPSSDEESPLQPTDPHREMITMCMVLK
ncbi:hypothetical protein B566_EDAN000937 [Ephemera danica]|nr:hypothetical protein B566_EDAN000937 [Ephemera danica]